MTADTTVYDKVWTAEDATWTGPDSHAMPADAMTFVTRDGGTELVCLDVSCVLPIPEPGDRIGLHDLDVVVTEVATRYGRDEETGQVRLFTFVRVAAEAN